MAGVDFAAVREAISMSAVLQLPKFEPVEENGPQLRGTCPIHQSQSPGSRTFSVNLDKNAFRCFTCGAKGNQLDLWAKVHGLSLFDAAIDLCQRANVGVPAIATAGAGTCSDTEKRNP
jgi:DNA primase